MKSIEVEEIVVEEEPRRRRAKRRGSRSPEVRHGTKSDKAKKAARRRKRRAKAKPKAEEPKPRSQGGGEEGRQAQEALTLSSDCSIGYRGTACSVRGTLSRDFFCFRVRFPSSFLDFHPRCHALQSHE